MERTGTNQGQSSGSADGRCAAGAWRRWLAACALALGVLAGGARGAEARESAAQLAKRADGELRHDDQLRDRQITVAATDGGELTLKGTVRSDAERARAQRLVRVPGVKWVHNELVVADGRATVPAPAPAPGANKRVDVGGEVNKAGDKVGRALDESWLTTKVKAQLMNDAKLAGTDIRVATDMNVVSLEGVVPSEAARARALEIARTTTGVSGVEDRLVVMQKR